MNAIIVDDEPKAIQLIQGYASHFNHIEVLETFRNGLKAFEFLSSNKVDLIFLDISMPDLSGISLSKMIDPKIKVIFTTAYSEYAVESYEVNAVDYLVKPISLERFSKAVSKVLEKESNAFDESKSIIMIKSGIKTHRVATEEIFYLKKDGNYMIYYLANEKIMARESISEALAVLPDSFSQSHKSYVINTNQIKSIIKDAVEINQTQIPISDSFRKELLTKIEK
jgi:two-component system, LytTR family, response regulator